LNNDSQSNREFRILDAALDSDYAEWEKIWAAWPDREVHAHPGYVRLFAGEEDSALCAIQGTDGSAILYPFLKRSIPPEILPTAEGKPFCDITSPYGYGGAVAWGANDATSIDVFWKAFDAWAAKQRVVSEFVRFSLFDSTLISYPGKTRVTQDNVVRDLLLTVEELWMDFDHKVRKNVKKALRNNVSVIVDEDAARFEDFYKIYEATMDRREAGESYYFPRAFFESIHRDLPGQFAYFHAVVDGVTVSTELVLVSAVTAYSFLGGTTSDYFDLRPNDLLKHEIMLWAKGRGKKFFVLGGGFGGNDGIYRYKLAFAPSGNRPFSVGSRILDTGGYASLVEAAELRGPLTDNYFPRYRG
jgi:hypothetical protein